MFLANLFRLKIWLKVIITNIILNKIHINVYKKWKKYLCTAADILPISNKYIFTMNLFIILSSNPRLHQILKSELRNLIIEFWIFPISSLIGLFKIFEKYFLIKFWIDQSKKREGKFKMKKRSNFWRPVGQTEKG